MDEYTRKGRELDALENAKELERLRVLKEHELGVELKEAPEGSGPYVPKVEGEPEESQRAFGGRLRDRGFESFKYTGGPHADRMGWRGIGLRHDGGGDDGDGGGGGSEGGGDEPPSSSATSEDQGRPSADKREQDTQNAANDAEAPPMSGGSSEVPPIDESALDKAESHEEAGGIGGIGGNIQQPPTNGVRIESSSDKGPNPPILRSEAAEGSSDTTEGLTDEQASRVLELVREGMAEGLAIKEVLGQQEV